MKSIFRNAFFALLIGMPFFSSAQSQKETEQIKAVILKTFEAMKVGDTLALASCFSPAATLYVSSNKAEGAQVRAVPASNFVQSIAKRKPGALDERVVSWGPILIDHEIASAWVPYTFHLDGVFSHKGVDVFLLVKVAGEFKIHTLMYNMQKE